MDITVKHQHHFHEPLVVIVRNQESHCDFLIALDRIAGQLETIAARSTNSTSGEQHMALSTQEQAIVDRFNAATTAISNKIDALIANSANLDDAEFNAQLQAIADGLDALGRPNTPVPGPGPQPVA